MGTTKNRLFLVVPLQFLALWAAKHAFLSGKSLKTKVFRDSHIPKHGLAAFLCYRPVVNILDLSIIVKPFYAKTNKFVHFP
jgi:hypothetical protein